jgi:hypothetical protein
VCVSLSPRAWALKKSLRHTRVFGSSGGVETGRAAHANQELAASYCVSRERNDSLALLGGAVTADYYGMGIPSCPRRVSAELLALDANSLTSENQGGERNFIGFINYVNLYHL